MADSKPKFENVYEKLYKKSLQDEEVAEMRYNLVGYLKVLIEMDQQHKAWLLENTKKSKSNLSSTDSK
jgi:hypothetical protein